METFTRTRINPTSIYSGLGKLPPSSIDLEEAVLGAILLEKEAIENIEFLKPEMFYKDNHQKIFNAIQSLVILKSPVDILTVTAQLRKAGELEMVGGAYYITELTNRVASAANIEFHARIIQQKFIQRELIRIATDVIQSAYEDTTDVLDLLDNHFASVDNLRKGIFTSSEKSAKDLVVELREDQKREKKNGLLGLTTGISGVDMVLKGDCPGDVRIIAAATSMGKSTVLTSEVLNCCFDKDKNLLKEQIPVVIFNLEMASLKSSTRLMADLSSIDKDKISSGKMDDYEKARYEEYLQKFEQSKIFIEDCTELTIDQFEIKIRTLVKKYGIKKAYIDTIQLMKGNQNKKYATRELELSDIGRTNKAIAKKYGITIIELAQLNDDLDAKRNYIPLLKNIRECKALGHDADNVMFVWRPDYYEDVPETLKSVTCSLFGGETIYDFKNMGFFIVAKNREGTLGKIPFSFQGNISRVSDHLVVRSYLEQKENNGQLGQQKQSELTTQPKEAGF